MYLHKRIPFVLRTDESYILFNLSATIVDTIIAILGLVGYVRYRQIL